jgi:adenylate cyclase
MGQEIERKFLVKTNRYRQLAKPLLYRQGYLSTARERVVRVRIKPDGASVTIKGTTSKITRIEYQYDIPAADAEHILAELCEKPIIEKTRYKVEHEGLVWDVDEFHGANEGLVVAEVHLKDPDQQISLPDWVGPEVSEDPRYFSSSLVQNPYSKW